LVQQLHDIAEQQDGLNSRSVEGVPSTLGRRERGDLTME
jgi:hypothetical protein